VSRARTTPPAVERRLGDMLVDTLKEAIMHRSLRTLLVAAALLTVALGGPGAGTASAARAVGFDATHDFSIDTTFSNGSVLQCSTDPFSGTGTVRVQFPDRIVSPVAGWAYFSANLQRYVNGQWMVWGGDLPWYYNWSYPSGALYYARFRELGTDRWANFLTLGWTMLPAGYYRLNLQFYWPVDRRHAVYETDWCSVG
jgi:hypothetical protein